MPAKHRLTSELVGVAMIGAGFIAEYHLGGLAAAGGASVRLIAGRNPDKARQLAARFGVHESSGDWRRALDRADVDAVIIATPDDTHEQIALAAAAAGKHILVQKPMAGSVVACERIMQGARSAGVDLQVSFMHRYFEEVQQARELLAAGAIGPVHSIRIRNATAGPDWGDWFFDPACVAHGVVDQLGVHGIDLATWLLGPIRNVCARVEIQLPTRRLRDGRIVAVNAPDTAIASYGFGAAAGPGAGASETIAPVGSHEMSMIEAQGCDRFRIELYGERGTIWLRSERGRLAIWAPHLHGQVWHVPLLEEAPLGQRHHARWLGGLRDESAREHTAAQALAGMQVVEAIHRSASSGGVRVEVGVGDEAETSHG